MPRIDPLQLLKCLSVLLSPNGGIKSKDEVQRLASLMTKFSKKLVSKCIYVQILKTTDTELLDMFMGASGWDLLHTWLSDAIVAKNWPLILELLELLLMCPVDVKRLKTNTCPKLIKGLSRDSCNQNARQLAIKLVDQWLKIVKAESYSVPSNDKVHISAASLCSTAEQKPVVAQSLIQSNIESSSDSTVIQSEKIEEFDKSESSEISVPETVVLISEDNKPIKVESVSVSEEPISCSSTVEDKKDISELPVKEEESLAAKQEKAASTEQLPVYKITIRDGKQVLATVHGREKVNKKSGSKEETLKEEKSDLNINIKDEDEISRETESIDTEKVPVVKIEKHRAKVEKTDSVSSNESTKGSPKSRHKKSKSKHDHKSTGKNDKKSKTSDLRHEKSKDSIKDKSKTSSKDKSKPNENKLKDREKLKERDTKSKEKKSGNSSPNYIQDEKDRATLAKLIPPSVSKLGKIPKKPKTEEQQKSVDSKHDDDIKKLTERKSVLPPPSYEPKKPSMSIEVRKPDIARPSTVKTFKSKFRSIGLEEEVKPPPSRKEIKKNTIMPVDKKLPLSFPVKPLSQPPSLKRPSPVKEVNPPEKKMKIIDLNVEDSKKEKPGGVKIIPPRPKPGLQESDMFMDALTACSKVEQPRKRKRRLSTTKEDQKKEVKEEGSTPPASPTTEDNSKSPPIVKPSFRFYQDTLEASEENKDATESDKKDDISEALKLEIEESSDTTKSVIIKSEDESMEVNEDENKTDIIRIEEDGDPASVLDVKPAVRKGVLVYHKVKGPKKSVRFKAEKDLEDIKYFELDETERVNVTKNFFDMKEHERKFEREAFFLARKLPNDDVMEEKMQWYTPHLIELKAGLIESGKNSQEKDIQYARERNVLQALYFSRSLIPDSPSEPDMEIHATTDPTIIPLEDSSGNPDGVNDFTNTPWPDPKPLLIPQSPPHQFQTPKGLPQQMPQHSPTHQPPPTTQLQQQPQPNLSPQYQSFPVGPFPPGNPIFNPPPQSQPPLLSLPNIPPNIMNMNIPQPLLMTPNIPPLMNPGGDWRTGDGKVIPMGEMPMDMYNQGAPNMGMQWDGNTMPGNEMGMFPAQPGFQMGSPNMYPQWNANMPGDENNSGGNNNRGDRGGQSGRSNHGNRGRGNRDGRGNSWHQGNSWHSKRGSGRGNSRGSSRPICRHFMNGYCRNDDKCHFLHTSKN